MLVRTLIPVAFCAIASWQTCTASTISATYAFSGFSISGSPTSPPVVATGTGDLTPAPPFGSMTWLGDNFPNMATGANTGTFTMTFADGTLVGNLHEQLAVPISNPAAETFTQVLDITGGTGALQNYDGVLTGGGTLDLLTGTFSTSGAGTISTTPEPGSAALLLIGLACLAASRARRTKSGPNHR
jgi:hypothetical protein